MNQAPRSFDIASNRSSNRPVTVGLAGCGQMGTDIVVQTRLMPGVRLGAVCEMRANQARTAASMAGYDDDDIAEASTPAAIDRVIEAGKLAVTQDAAALAAAGRVEVVIDATGNPNSGASLALDVISNGKHIVMLNVEADITVGRYLKREAERAGVVYSLAAGDEPICALELVNFARALGLEIVCAGKGKNNPLKIDAVPSDYQEEARARNMNPRMLVEFIDGSKTMIEMVALANATGLIPDTPGMHGPEAQLTELARVLCPKSHGGVLSRRGCVDYSIGASVAPGVFCIVETRHPRVLERFVDLKVGTGPFFTLHRPYHLTSIEAPLTARRIMDIGAADMQPLDRPVAEAITLAKRDLKPGEVMGRIGETDYRCFAVTAQDARTRGALPMGLVEGAVILKPIEAGAPLTRDNARANPDLLITQLRAQLDEADARAAAAAA